MTTPLDIIRGALRSIGALESGETPPADEANDCFVTLNDMLAQWSEQSMMIPYTSEVVFNIVGGTKDYTIGPGGTCFATMTGSIAGTVLTVTALSAGSITMGMTLTGASVTAGTTITSFVTGAGGQQNPLGTYNLSASSTASSTTITGYYQRPLAIVQAFVRVATLDYPVDVKPFRDYELIGLKSISSTWPRLLYYQPSLPLGNIALWPLPQQGEMHMYADTVLGQFNTTADVIQLPQGYNLALRFGLAELLMPEYGVASSAQAELVTTMAKRGRAYIKSKNMRPQAAMTFDPVLSTNQRADAGWIMSGGFR